MDDLQVYKPVRPPFFRPPPPPPVYFSRARYPVSYPPPCQVPPPPHPTDITPFPSLLSRFVHFLINTTLGWFWYIAVTTDTPTMSPSPSPSPIELYLQQQAAETQLFRCAVRYLNECRWQDAFETICAIEDVMHTTPNKHLSLHLLPDVNRLFASIMQHHAYAVEHRIDYAVNNLLRLAVQFCQKARENHDWTFSDHRIRWMTPIEVEIGQHLQFYRMFCHYLDNYSMSLESDRVLDETRTLLQKLCPTVNNLTGWVPATPPRDIRQDMQEAAATKNTLTRPLRRRSQRLRSHQPLATSEPAASKPRHQRKPSRPRRAKMSPPRQLLTPPTQTDELLCHSTYETEDYVPSLATPITPSSTLPRSPQLPSRGAAEEEPTQLVGSRALQYIKLPAPRPRPSKLLDDFMLRPVHIHVRSQKCCSGL
ncbi:hypothetical protein QBC40DRAFT_176851 [Triangularia verruculosa]|uniref:Uncharacterized protein n=1 Tax=Triangularia verruculosa TaxID=2587418 RepID=A0AAN7AUK0_9PEZI|nr:hypothetical protein QBC40DRAFT_176851 [Triangularia verruculosa]